MFLDWFRGKKGALKLKAKQEVEIEFLADETYKTYFTTILDVRRKEVILKNPGTERRPVRIESGQAITVTTIDEGKLYYFDTTVTDAGEREFDIATPSTNQSEDIPKFEPGSSIEAPVGVEYRAMKLAHTQSATTHSLSLDGMVLSCNIGIPTGTDLHIEVQIPGAPTYSFKGKATGARLDPNSKTKKYLCDIEYAEDANKDDKLSIMRYAVYLKRREERRKQRGEL
ncbi:flagellar brake protein [bacterium]|nr:flagellar brake protein [bacterium]